MALNNLALRLGELGRREDALAAIEETPGPRPPSIRQADYFRSSYAVIRVRMRLMGTAGSGRRIAHGTQPTVCVTAPFTPKSR